jgi:hypothetical protein
VDQSSAVAVGDEFEAVATRRWTDGSSGTRTSQARAGAAPHRRTRRQARTNFAPFGARKGRCPTEAFDPRRF